MATPQPLPQHRVWERARLARDARFDGRFYIGVRSTGIYCRPICPANSPKPENIEYFATAAAASEAGYRPCLRCRPECAPGTPAWSGTSATVRRGLRLIAGGALDDGDVERLAERLGVTSRHLRRLFTRHVGASPLAVAHTQRLHFAKRLIDDTRLPMTQVAAAAGYGSVRRFNDAFRKTYGRSPRDLRKEGRGQRAAGRTRTASLSLRLPYRQPFDWSSMLAFLEARAIPGVEQVSGDRYRRTLALDGEHCIVEVMPARETGYLLLTLRSVATSRLFDVSQRAREALDLDAPVADIAACLRRDPRLCRLLSRSPGVRVPGAWDGFELSVRAILGQQVSVRAATTLAGRIVERHGARLRISDDCEGGRLTHLFPEPAALARAALARIGMVTSRVDTVRRLSGAVACGDLSFDPAQDFGEFCRVLRGIKGIGDWTAQYVAMRVLKYPDAFPASDLGLLKAARPPERLAPAALAALAENWRPWRAYAAMLLWGSLLDSGG